MTTRRLSAVPDAVLRAGLYVRVSAVMGRTGDDFLSPSIQVDTMRAAAERSGHRVVEVWEDIDVSGRSMERPALTEAMNAAREGRIDVLWCYDLSRFARNAAGGLAELASIEAMGVEVMSATETVDRKTSSGKLTAGLLLLLAEMKSDQIAETWSRVIAANAERGVLHGRAPNGYIRTAKRTVEVDPVLGPAMTLAFQRAAAGESLQAIARDLSRIKGQRVMPSTLRKALLSPVYLGMVRHQGQVLPGRHEPLTDQATFDLCRIRLDASAVIPPRTKEARHPLAGLARCAECGYALWARRARPPKSPVDHFSCRTARTDGTSSCKGCGTPPMAEVEAIVLDEVRRRLVDVPDPSSAMAVRLSKQARGRADLRTVLDELARAEKAVGNLAVQLADGILSPTAYTAAAEVLELRITGLRERRQEAESAAVHDMTFEQARDSAAALLDLWPDLTDRERNAMLRTHVDRVLVRRQNYRREPVADRVTVLFHAGC